MTNYRSLNHSKWACQYHVVFIPKYRKKAIYGSLRRHLGGVLRELARQRESEVEEGHLLADHVHMLVSIPPKYSVAQVIGYMKGKSAIHIAREFAGRSRSFVGQHFWARGYFVSTLGRDERAIRAYIRAQKQEDRRQEQLRLDETATRRVAQVAAQWPRPAALSGSQLKPPALPGDTYSVQNIGHVRQSYVPVTVTLCVPSRRLGRPPTNGRSWGDVAPVGGRQARDGKHRPATGVITSRGVGALIQRGGRAVAGMLTIATAGGS